MTNAIVLASEVTQITTAADSDDMLVELFIRTKRSEKTRVQYAHSTGLLRGFVGKPLASMTLQDAVDYYTHT